MASLISLLTALLAGIGAAYGGYHVIRWLLDRIFGNPRPPFTGALSSLIELW